MPIVLPQNRPTFSPVPRLYSPLNVVSVQGPLVVMIPDKKLSTVETPIKGPLFKRHLLKNSKMVPINP